MDGQEPVAGVAASPRRRSTDSRRKSSDGVVPNGSPNGTTLNPTPTQQPPATPNNKTPGKLRKNGSKLKLYAPRLPAVSSAMVLVLFALLAPIVDRAYHRLATEGKIVSDVSTFSHDVGRFQVKWNKVRRCKLTSARPRAEIAWFLTP